MALNSDLISQLVEITNDNQETNKETTVYGTIVEYEGKKYVKLDGSDLLTPMSSTAVVKDNDRVMVQIKNHTATVTGNLTTPSASSKDVETMGSKITEFEIVVSYKVSTDELEAINATLENLKAVSARIENADIVYAEIESLQVKMGEFEYISAEDMKVINAEIERIESEFGQFTDISAEDAEIVNAEITNLKAYTAEFTYVSTEVLTAIKADIKTLNTEKLSAKDADLKYANIDFSNIGEAAITKIFSESGIIKDLIVSEGKITGELVGVTIKGDLIEGNTIKADKLVVKGSDGIYYKLNFEAGTFKEGEVVPTDGLHGSVIVAESITAEKIAVDDLVAFDATIGGFKIDTHSIYSGVKSSADNTTRGIYLDDDGQAVFGDSNNYLKYYKDTDGNYKLDISAATIRMGGSTTTLEEDINSGFDDVNQRLDETNEHITSAEILIDSINGAIQNMVTDADGTSLMTQTSTGWTFNISGIQESLEKASSDLNDLTESIGNVDGTVEALNAAVSSLETKTESIDIGIFEDEPSIILSEGDSAYKLLITNTRIIFIQGSIIDGVITGDILTYINTRGLVTKNIEVENEITQGEFVWKIHGQGNLGLIWKGGNG